ncbi:MAG: hypothetical protein A2Z77_04175 [Chloroflexi bacterium RBG_13_51_36]|nr:MAG: hypothetical protein A2Z77_04175 [Chloroflexi bacterium RBG_13_51_36]
MRNKLALMLILTILVASISVGCGGGSPCPSTLTILSITEGDVSVMKAGTDDWVEAQVEMELEVGDSVKTGGNSSAEITFFDGSAMELEAGTQIEILSLDIVCDTGVTTISLLQMIGDTISHVTEILDPASSYEVETPGGVAGVRGSGMRVQVIFGNPNYEDGTALVTNLEGNIYVIAQGVQVDVPVGQTCMITPGEPPNLMPVAADDSGTTLEYHRITIPVLDNDFDPDVGDTLTVASVTQGDHGQVFSNGNDVTYAPDPDFHDTDRFTYTVSDGHGGTDSATVAVTVATVETFAYIHVALEPGSAPIYIWDEMSNWWAIDEDTKYEINGIHHETTMTISVAAGRRYYVWVHKPEEICYVMEHPDGWTVTSAPVDDYEDEAAYGYAATDSEYSVLFGIAE